MKDDLFVIPDRWAYALAIFLAVVLAAAFAVAVIYGGGHVQLDRYPNDVYV